MQEGRHAQDLEVLGGQLEARIGEKHAEELDGLRAPRTSLESISCWSVRHFVDHMNPFRSLQATLIDLGDSTCRERALGFPSSLY